MGTGLSMVRPERFELPTFWFVARRSIQLSYERILALLIFCCRSFFPLRHLTLTLFSAGRGPYPPELRACCQRENSIMPDKLPPEFLHSTLRSKWKAERFQNCGAI